MRRKILFGVCTIGLAVTVACSNPDPTSPVMAGGAGAAAAADGSTLKISAPTLSSPTDGFAAALGSTDPITLILNNAKGTYTTIAATYEFEVRNPAGVVVLNPKNVVAGTTTTQTVIQTSSLTPDTVYTWRARANLGTAVGPWSSARSVRSPIPAGIFGQTVLDPLLDGKTFGKQRGGRFIVGQGWQALTRNDGIDYDIPTLTNGTVEFDITNIGQKEGEPFSADFKFLSMAEVGAFNDFGSFRDGPWKMHLVQRGDTDGLEIIWRNGGAGDGPVNPGDHRIKMPCCGPKFTNTTVNHFVVRWSPAGYSISASTDGGPLIEYMEDGFGGIPYAPPDHRISLGCYPRGETIPGSIFRNVKVTPNK